MDLVPGAVQEARVDEDHPVPGGLDARLQVERSALLLVHDPELDGALRQPERRLDRGEQLHGERNLGRSVLLGLDQVDAAGARVAEPAQAAQVVQRGGDRHQGVQDALGDRLSVGEHRVGDHVVSDRPHQQQRPARQDDRAAVGTAVVAVRVHHAVDLPAVLGEVGGQPARHQPQPGAVGGRLVGPVHGGYRVLEVDDGGHRRLHQDVRDACGVPAAHRVGAVDQQLDVQPVAAQQQRALTRPGELGRVRQPGRTGRAAGDQGAVDDAVARHVGVRARGEREELVQQPVHRGDHLAAAARIVAGGEPAVQWQRVGAVERVVERSPAGVRGVQRVPRHRRGHHELRPGDPADLLVHAGHLDTDLRHRDEVAQLGQEGLVLGGVGRTPAAVPVVDRGLEPVPLGEQPADRWSEALLQVGKGVPERLGSDVQAGQQLVGNEVRERRVYRDAGAGVERHRRPLRWSDHF